MTDNTLGRDFTPPAPISEKYIPPSEKLAEAEEEVFPCPIVPLGKRGGRYFALSADGEMRVLGFRDLNLAGLESLFEGDLEWLCVKFPKRNNDGELRPGTVNLAAARRWFIRACAAEGVFDALTEQRGPGVWAAEGSALAHCGDEILFAGDWLRAGMRRPEAIYPAGPRIARPAEAAAGAEIGRKLIGLAQTWRFAEDYGADLFVGWIGQALMGAAHSWRVHMRVNAEHGAGKSWLGDLARAALGGQAHVDFNDYTEAGLRQLFTGEARAFILDEAEGGPGGPVWRTIQLLRRMSGGGGARVARGSATGLAQGFTVNGSALLLSISAPPLQPQDRSRFITAALRKFSRDHNGMTQRHRVKTGMEEIAAVSPALRRRAIEAFPVFTGNVEKFHAALAHMKCDPREADSLAAILAGRDMLIREGAADSDSIDEDMALFAPFIEATKGDSDEDTEGRRAADLLTTTPYSANRGDEEIIGELMVKGVASTGVEARKRLGRIGVKIVGAGAAGATPFVLVANQHQALTRIYRDSRWAGGGWAAALRYLPGAHAWPTPARFGGFKSRCTAIPASAFVETEAGDREEVDGES